MESTCIDCRHIRISKKKEKKTKINEYPADTGSIGGGLTPSSCGPVGIKYSIDTVKDFIYYICLLSPGAEDITDRIDRPCRCFEKGKFSKEEIGNE